MFGLGLNTINLKSHKITKIKLPETENPYHDEFLVLDLYPDTSNKNLLNIVCWVPWEVSCWSFDHKNSIFTKSENKKHLIKSILNIYGKNENSKFVDNLIDLFINSKFDTGLPNPLAYETIQLIYLRKDIKTIKQLLDNPDNKQKVQAIYQIVHLEDPEITELFLETVRESNDFFVRKQAIKSVCYHIKNPVRKNYLLNEISKYETNPELQKLIKWNK